MKYQQRKRAKTTNNLYLCDNNYNIMAISECISGNHHDAYHLCEHFDNMLQSLDRSHIDYSLSHLNGDSGFDCADFRKSVQDHKMTDNIKKNKRNSKNKDEKWQYFSELIYAGRFKIEVVFAWCDTFKRTLIRFELLAQNFRAWLLLTASLINFRNILN